MHHIAYVVSFMARITTSEQLSRDEVRRGVLAALLHDIGIGDAVLSKITEEMIENASETDRPRLRRDGVASRREHMEKGVQISCRLLENYQLVHPHALSNDDIAVILDIVGTHDNSKIPLMEDSVNKKWLLSSNPKDWLKQCHWEADALWMLSPAGILVDLQRQNEEDIPQNRKLKFDFNLGLHREIVKLYAQAYSDQEMVQFGFRDSLLYRTQTGYNVAMEFKRQVDAL